MSRRWRIVLTVGFAAAAVLNATVLFVALRPTWAPLGPYPTQTIGLPREKVPTSATGSDTATAEYPVLRVRSGQWPELPVQSEKCAHETVTVTGTVSWRSVEPPGASYTPNGPGTAIRTEGCTRFAYRNVVPDGVRDRVRTLAGEGTVVTLWSVNGAETPTRDGQTGAVQPTETFAIVWEP